MIFALPLSQLLYDAVTVGRDYEAEIREVEGAIRRKEAGAEAEAEAERRLGEPEGGGGGGGGGGAAAMVSAGLLSPLRL